MESKSYLQQRRWFLGASHLGGYMHRWLARTPLGSVRIHRILRSDNDPDMHDHPFDFTSAILSGGYFEHRPGCRCTKERVRWGSWPADGVECRWYGPGDVIHRRAEDAHQLQLLEPAMTLVFAGPYRRNWGYHTQEGWVEAHAYHARFTGKKMAR